MCYRVHDLDHRREKAAQQDTPATPSLRPRLGERWAALMAWLRPSAKPAIPVTSPARVNPAEAAAKAAPIDQPSTGAGTSAEAREREAETV